MNTTNIMILWLVAWFFTTFAWVPQIIRILKVKETKDISLSTYLMVSFGITCWLIYWILLWDYPIIIANWISLVFSLTIVAFKLKFG